MVYEDKEGFVRWFKVMFPPDQEETVTAFKEWCKEHTGNNYIQGIALLLDLADLQFTTASLLKRFEELEEKVNDKKPDEGVRTMGGKTR